VTHCWLNCPSPVFRTPTLLCFQLVHFIFISQFSACSTCSRNLVLFYHFTPTLSEKSVCGQLLIRSILVLLFNFEVPLKKKQKEPKKATTKKWHCVCGQLTIRNLMTTTLAVRYSIIAMAGMAIDDVRYATMMMLFINSTLKYHLLMANMILMLRFLGNRLLNKKLYALNFLKMLGLQ
jgi:hypothetical protein